MSSKDPADWDWPDQDFVDLAEKVLGTNSDAADRWKLSWELHITTEIFQTFTQENDQS